MNPALVLICLILSSCATLPANGLLSGNNNEHLISIIDTLASQIEHAAGKPETRVAPVAIVSGNAMRGGEYTRLDEFVITKITSHLQEKREIYQLSDQNWFQFREHRSLLPLHNADTLLVYEVILRPEPALAQMSIIIRAYDQQMRSLPGLGATATLPYTKDSVLAEMYRAAPIVSPYPLGLEENPYRSVEQLTYKLGELLHDTYLRNYLNNKNAAKDQEINVQLHMQPTSDVPTRFLTRLTNSLQQTVVAHNGFTCAISNQDMSPLFEQLDFYQTHRKRFEAVDTLLRPATILLLTKITSSHKGLIGIYLRAVWLETPVETRDGKLFESNLAGTYISGLTARAYIKLKNDELAGGSGDGVTVCLGDFPSRLRQQAVRAMATYPESLGMTAAPDTACRPKTPDNCRCFNMITEKQPDFVLNWMIPRLQEDLVIPFDATTTSQGVYLSYNGGYD